MRTFWRAGAACLSLTLGGCLSTGQKTVLKAQATASLQTDGPLIAEPVQLPGMPTRAFRSPRGGVDPIRTLERQIVPVRDPEPVKAAQRTLHTGGSTTMLAAATPALDDVPSVLAAVAAAKATHERNAQEARSRDRDIELRSKRITSSICSGC